MILTIKKTLTLLFIVSIITMFSVQTVFSHGAVYETNPLGDNKIRITLHWSDPNENKGITITHYYLKNGKTLNIGYETKEGLSKSTVLDYDLSSAIPPIRIILNDINNADDAQFDDIQGTEAEEYIEHLHDAGIVNGRTGNLFKPFERITRAEFMVLMVKALNLNEKITNIKHYKDIDNHWAKNVILIAVENGLISGYEDQTIRPDNPITLAEVSTIISRAYSFKTAYNGIYAKLKQDAWFSFYVKRMFDVGVLKTTDNLYKNFDERAYINRANCAMMVSRSITTY